MDKNGIKDEKVVETTFKNFQEWFRKLNKECSGDPSEIKIIGEEKWRTTGKASGKNQREIENVIPPNPLKNRGVNRKLNVAPSK